MKKIYFAHPINVYGTELEEDLIHLMGMELGGWDIENPNKSEHQIGYARSKRKTGNGMSYFTEVVLPECDACVFLAFRDGKVPAGVAKEVQWFLDQGMLVLEVVPLGMTYVREALPLQRVLTVDETRLRIRNEDGSTKNY